MAEMAENERRILVAVDEGEESMYALTWCVKNLVFQNSKDTLILLYVKPPRAIYSAFDGTSTSNGKPPSIAKKLLAVFFFFVLIYNYYCN